ncbi:MAG TPA: argininosuccinate lyase, partial [Balneolaceae bacterium]|nr:argininosuccinate lyase [Balneolaceae bacterium]
DFQILKEQLFPAIEELKSCLFITKYAAGKIGINDKILDDPKYKLIFSVEAVNELVKDGVPFRDAYQQVAQQIEDGSFEPPTKLNHTHEGSIGNLRNEEIAERLNEVMLNFK